MRRMLTNKNVVDVVNDAIEAGEIEVGGSSLYMHNVILKSSTGTLYVHINWLSSQSTSYTFDSFKAAIAGKGDLNCTGRSTTGGVIVCKMYCSSSSSDVWAVQLQISDGSATSTKLTALDKDVVIEIV